MIFTRLRDGGPLDNIYAVLAGHENQIKSTTNETFSDANDIFEQSELKIAPGAGDGVVEDVATGQVVFNVDDAVAGIAEESDTETFQQGITEPHKGRFLRGTNKTTGQAADVVAGALTDEVLVKTDSDGKIVDQWETVAEAREWADQIDYLDPVVDTTRRQG